MRPADACSAPGVIVGVAGLAAWRVSLPNGHHLVARRRRQDPEVVEGLVPGVAVIVMVSPADMSKGLLVRQTESRMVRS
jgi:hypothetical protein